MQVRIINKIPETDEKQVILHSLKYFLTKYSSQMEKTVTLLWRKSGDPHLNQETDTNLSSNRTGWHYTPPDMTQCISHLRYSCQKYIISIEPWEKHQTSPNLRIVTHQCFSKEPTSWSTKIKQLPQVRQDYRDIKVKSNVDPGPEKGALMRELANSNTVCR